ncbi:Frag1/DRAM/Sfk1 [Penicillium lagena]|uniref:Frag1/DRAM/Sfk1 n=1 Tax=Penicillium lagena TaxID=94218 RepID=UPI0025412B0E|nr:Frag1/DRAM/Sfk1 [Penicillium lagena]KAJ5601280.1 Frag1/DRAM/Sfk1 [Penicillium lagena]
MWILSFWLFPVISGCMWIATLVGMLASWTTDGDPIYSTMGPGLTIPFISHIGAEGLKPLFIAGCAVTGVFLDLALLSERWLRHSGQLARNRGVFDKTCAVGSIVFSVAGALGLVLLAVFDVKHHNHLHYGFLIMFISSYVVSAILVCLEYILIGRFYRPQLRILLVSFYIKASFILLEIGVAIGFGICMNAKTSSRKNAAAILEWVAALIFAFFVFSLVIDLLPSVRTRKRIPQGEKYPFPSLAAD